MIFTRPDEVFIFKSLISDNEKTDLLQWAIEQKAQGNFKSNGKNVKCWIAKHNELTSIPNLFWQLRDRIVKLLELEGDDYYEEPIYKSLLINVEPGGVVQSHRDHTIPGYWHIRANVLLSKPQQGGLPIVEKQQIDINENDMWVFSPSYARHWSTIVKGDKERMVCSYGLLVKTQTLHIHPPITNIS